jgi:hypothetical protein
MALVKYLAVSDEPDGSAAADQRGVPVPGGRSQRLSPAAVRQRGRASAPPKWLNSSSARR